MRCIHPVLIRIFATFATLVASAPAPAQSAADKTLTIVVPYAPGGGHDAMARVLAERLGQCLGHTVVAENRTGANGMIGAEYVSRAAADGSVVLFSSPAEIVISPSAYKTMRYDPAKDLVPVTLAGMTPMMLVAHPAVGVKSMPELIAKVRQSPGQYSFGTSGNATSQHLAGVWINKLAGIDLQHIPYRGAGPAINDVLGGQIAFAIVGMAPILPHLRAGKLVPVAVTTAERVGWARDVATVAETPGMKGFEATHWMGVFAPGRTPPQQVQALQKAFAAALADPDVKARLIAMGIEPVGNSSAEFRASLIADRARFAKMFALTGLSPE